jgi:hypothetical protein
MPNDSWSTDGNAVRIMRRLLLLILGLSMLGTAGDLLLIAHYEDGWQLPPLVLIGIALVIVGWLGVGAGKAASPPWIAVLALRVTMTMFVAAGVAGVLLHYNGNREFQTEMDPSLTGWALFAKVVTAKAPPALAPGVMVQLGLLGLLYTYRHPALMAQRRAAEPNSTGAM